MSAQHRDVCQPSAMDDGIVYRSNPNWDAQYISTRSVNRQVIWQFFLIGHFDWYRLINWSRLFLHFYTLPLPSNSLVASKMADFSFLCFIFHLFRQNSWELFYYSLVIYCYKTNYGLWKYLTEFWYQCMPIIIKILNSLMSCFKFWFYIQIIQIEKRAIKTAKYN